MPRLLRHIPTIPESRSKLVRWHRAAPLLGNNPRLAEAMTSDLYPYRARDSAFRRTIASDGDCRYLEELMCCIEDALRPLEPPWESPDD